MLHQVLGRFAPAQRQRSILGFIAGSITLFGGAHSAQAQEALSPPATTTEPAAEPEPAAAPPTTAPAEMAIPTAKAPPAEPAGVTPESEVPPPAPAPYSLPFALRPAGASSALRLDTAFAFYDSAPSKSAFAAVPVLTFSYKVIKGFAPLVRVGLVANSPADPTPSGAGFTNPALGGTYAFDLSTDFRLALFLGFTIPIGIGGGDSPDQGNKVARGVGINARSGMDNALFAVNDFTVFPGVDLAFVKAGFTAQVEATLLQLTRVRGSADQSDSSKTNLTLGFHAGYFVIPAISFGAEIRHQRWLSTPAAVKANDAARDTTTVAVGPRFHFQVSKGKWLRPGISYGFPLDDPMKKSSYKIVQLDIPFTF